LEIVVFSSLSDALVDRLITDGVDKAAKSDLDELMDDSASLRTSLNIGSIKRADV